METTDAQLQKEYETRHANLMDTVDSAKHSLESTAESVKQRVEENAAAVEHSESLGKNPPDSTHPANVGSSTRFEGTATKNDDTFGQHALTEEMGANRTLGEKISDALKLPSEKQ